VHGEALELVQLKAALSRSAAEAAAATSKAELIAALGRVMENAVAIAATQGVSRAELEGRLRPTAHSRSVFRQVSELRSSVARAARDGSVRVTSHLYPRRRAAPAANRTRKERATELPQAPIQAVAAAALNSARLHETVTIVTQRFLGTRSMPLTRVRSFTRVVPVARAWTRDAIGRGLRAAGQVPPAAAGSGKAAEIPTVVLSASKYRSAKWVGQRPPRVPAGGAPTTAIVSPPRLELASRKELAQWAVTAASQLVVERLVLPYLRRVAAQRIEAAAAGGLGQLLRAAIWK
jgi:hypothetical protein